jgi:hypothetical protein
LKGLLHLEYLIYLPINYKEESQMEELHRTWRTESISPSSFE